MIYWGYDIGFSRAWNSVEQIRIDEILDLESAEEGYVIIHICKLQEIFKYIK